MDKGNQITFSQPVDVAGHVLVAGTYISDGGRQRRHIVQVFSGDHKHASPR